MGKVLQVYIRDIRDISFFIVIQGKRKEQQEGDMLLSLEGYCRFNKIGGG